MPARIVVMHDYPDFIERIVTALREARFDVVSFTDTMSALEASEAAQRIEMLITWLIFGPGQPNGILLTLMARLKHPDVNVLFVALLETRVHTEGVGEVLPATCCRC